MNNSTHYNLSNFNIYGEDNEEFDIVINCYEKCDITITFGINSEIKLVCTEKININSNGALSYLENFNLNENINIDTNLNVVVPEEFISYEHLKISSYISQNTNMKLKFDENIKNIFNLQLNSNFNFEFLENIKCDNLNLAENIYMIQRICNEDLYSNISSYILENKSFVVEVTINPGEILNINSSDFTAYLNEKNILEDYSGDWIELSRDLKSIDLNMFLKGKFNANVIFKERYL